MEQNRSIRRRRSISEKSLHGIIIIGILLMVSTSMAAGITLYRTEIRTHTNYIYSFLRYYTSTVHLQSSDGLHPDILRFIEGNELDDEFYRMALKMDSARGNAELEDLYIVVPEEDKLVYICRAPEYHPDAGIYSEEQEQQFWYQYERPYGTGEKEIMMKEMADEGKDVLYMNLHPGEHPLIATALVPISDYEDNKIALVGADVAMEGLYGGIIRILINVSMLVAGILLIVFAIQYKMIHKQLIQPILKLKGATQDLIGNLNENKTVSFDIHTGDEIEDLADSFSVMDENLKEHIKENTRITQEKERISTELDLAAKIQMSMLPDVFPPFPDRKEFDIYASMTPAREVGGDFYDFFLIDEDHLCLVMADVSGKGIPASLFMMMSKSMLRNCAKSGMRPKDIMETVNEQLNSDNHEDMFVTVWLGILEISTGRITAVNAGHENPLLMSPESLFLEDTTRHCFVLGCGMSVTYREYELQMKPGGKLFLYTDGIPEAANAEEQLFGMDRTVRSLNKVKYETPEGILNAMRNDVIEFAGDAPQSDDMTMMCVVYNGPDSSVPVGKTDTEAAE